MFDNLKSALFSIWSNKVRSLLTVLGVVIGVSSVAILVSMGQGLKNDISVMIEGFGTNMMGVFPGNIETTGGSAGNPANLIATDILTEKDVKTVAKIKNIEAVTPLALTTGSLKYGRKIAGPPVYGAYPNIMKIIQSLPVADGKMFKSNRDGNVIVLGYGTKKALFGKNNPINKKVIYGRRELTVIGTLDRPKSAGAFESEFNNLAFIPFGTATEMNKGQVKIIRLNMKATDSSDVKLLKKQITQALLKNHEEKDFTVMTQDDMLDLFSRFLNMATTLISGIAAISLLVGGIGIMNIMFVSVTERTREIGLRKAVGAPKKAILAQFLTEAVAVTLVGGLLGLAVTFLTAAVVKSQTSLNPVISADVILMALGISSFIGITFGLWPALRAARKDPIEALRYE